MLARGPVTTGIGLAKAPGALPSLSARVPLLLLPARIETRFIDGAAGSELWVRVFPDQIHIDSHEVELTRSEERAGRVYWEQLWRAGKSPTSIEDLKGPWRHLAGAHGATRAAWIALQMQPTNLAQQPSTPELSGHPATVEAIFPSPPIRQSSWERAALARCLPDAWTVVTEVDGTIASYGGTPVRAEIAVSLTPRDDKVIDGLPVDAGLRWTVDFAEAESAGMALRIPLTASQWSRGFDRVMAYGVRADSVDARGEVAFAQLLIAHRFTDGLAFVPQGAPTNNTADAAAVFSRSDPGYETSFAVERQNGLITDSGADGAAFARGLGLPSALFDHVQYADRRDMTNPRQIMTALWPGTLGYFLSQMMADVFTDGQVSAAREWVIANVSGRGPLPALRAGNVPYGVIPVTSMRRWDPPQASGLERNLVGFIRNAWPLWLASSVSAPHFGGGDPDNDLVQVLGMDASSMSFRARWVLGDEFMWNSASFWGLPNALNLQWLEQHYLPLRFLLDRFGYGAWAPRILQNSFGDSYPIGYPTVQDGPLSETDPLRADGTLADGTKLNYISWLQVASIDDVRQEAYPGKTRPNSLLYRLLRQSVLLEPATLAMRTLVKANVILPEQAVEHELVNVVPKTSTFTPWSALSSTVPGQESLTFAQLFDQIDPQPGSPFGTLGELRASLAALAKLPTAELDRLLTETLDLCSHQLAAWVVSMAARLIPEGGEGKMPGLHIGGFGFVEGLQPAEPRPPVELAERLAVAQLDELRAKLRVTAAQPPTPSQPHSDNGGYIHAPSMTQAASAAVLRNGYLTHRGGTKGKLLAIDLSSDRVRTALWLLDGVRQGQPLGALLGYQFERGMHVAHLDRYLAAFRAKYPIGAKTSGSNLPAEAVAASNVVDGAALQRDDARLVPGQDWGDGLPGKDDAPAQREVARLLSQLDELTGALSDLSIAEGVYQLVRGNPGRAGGLLDAVSKGERPPEPEVVSPPRGGVDVLHRVVLLLSANQALAPSWRRPVPHPREAAEPTLSAWLSSSLPDPRRVKCSVSYRDAAGHRFHLPVTLAQLDVGPLDFLELLLAADKPQASELESRILYAAAVPAQSRDHKIDYTLDPSRDAGMVSFPDALSAARTLRDLVGGARALEPQDLIEPERRAHALGGAVDVGEINERARAARRAVRAAAIKLNNALPGAKSAPGVLRRALMEASYFGVEGAIPPSRTEAGRPLAALARPVIRQLMKRHRAAAAIGLSRRDPAPAALVMEAVFGPSIRVLPRFTLPDAANLSLALDASKTLLAGQRDAPAVWLQQLTHVRPAALRLDAALNAAQLLAGRWRPDLSVAQLPYKHGDRWLGLPLVKDQVPHRGKVSIAAVIEGAMHAHPHAGLMVDEWPERIPSRKETTGLAFHYEQPTALPPQAMLLALCPDQRPTWDDDLIQGILAETLELARIRTVDLDSIQDMGQILPALYFPFNALGETISLNLLDLNLSEVIGGLGNIVPPT